MHDVVIRIVCRASLLTPFRQRQNYLLICYFCIAKHEKERSNTSCMTFVQMYTRVASTSTSCMHIDRQVGTILTECDTHLLIVKHMLNQLQKDGVRLQALHDGIVTWHSSYAIIKIASFNQAGIL